jgi:uncharacterized protein YbaR (Trm112 family)
MYIEMIDLLRCPRDHEETWLVAAFTKMEARFVIEGKLGCPVCSASYSIEKGIADLRESISPRSRDRSQGESVDADLAMRIAAMLGLTRPNTLVSISGGEAALATVISELTECRVVALDPPVALCDTDKVARVLAGSRIPLASSSLDGLLVTGTADRLSDASRVLKPGGRLVTGTNAPLPAGFRELARDDLYVVAESVGPIVRLSR